MAKGRKPIPEGYHGITPQLTLDNAAQSIDWYKRALGAEELGRSAGPDGKIIHAEAESQAEAPVLDGPRPMVLPDYSDVNLTEVLPAPDGVAAVSDFPMHGIPRETVAVIVVTAGGEIVHVVDDDHARPEWNGYKYFVRRRDARR